MHKTGTSAIQKSLVNFDDGHFFYANLNDINHSIPLYTAFSKNPQKYHVWVNQGRNARFVAEKRQEYKKLLAKNLDREDRHTIIISGEDICSFDADEARDFLSTLKGYGREINVVCYLRDPTSFAASAFQESLKHGLKVIPQNISPNYKRKLEKFASASACNSIILKNFDRKDFSDGSVVNDFWKTIGMTAPKKTFQTNTSMTLQAARVILLFNSSNLVFKGDYVLWKAYSRFKNLIQYEFSDAERIDSKLFSVIADDSELDWLSQELRFQFRNYPAVNTLDHISGKDKLKEYLTETNEEMKHGIRYILSRLGVSTNLESAEELANRLYYRCVADFEESAFKPEHKALRFLTVHTAKLRRNLRNGL